MKRGGGTRSGRRGRSMLVMVRWAVIRVDGRRWHQGSGKLREYRWVLGEWRGTEFMRVRMVLWLGYVDQA